MHTLADRQRKSSNALTSTLRGQSTFTLDMLYQGQTHTVAVPVTPAMVQGNEPQADRTSLRKLYGSLRHEPRTCARRQLEGQRLRSGPPLDLKLLAPSHTTRRRSVKTDGFMLKLNGLMRVYDRLALGVIAK